MANSCCANEQQGENICRDRLADVHDDTSCVPADHDHATLQECSGGWHECVGLPPLVDPKLLPGTLRGFGNWLWSQKAPDRLSAGQPLCWEV